MNEMSGDYWGGGIAEIIELTKEIKLDSDNALLYARRSHCFRIIQQYYHAVKDAEMVIRLKPKWWKGYYCKGLAEFGAEHYTAALESFEEGLTYSSDDDLITALRKASRATFSARMTKRMRTVKGFFLGLVIGGLALAVNDFLLPVPIIQNIFLKVIVMASWGFCGVETAKGYSKMLEQERDQRLEPPKDPFPFISDGNYGSRNSDFAASCPREVETSTSTEAASNGDGSGRSRHRIQSQS
ncbi:uncharacterized protein [Diadema antillarum]|uniref:uncharacterized protein n=2 Tax=Diadema antillarum TaxID=105358 RepID=UPI003A878DF0